MTTNTNAPAQQPASLTVEQALRQAISHHQAGQLQDAERFYRAIIQTQPNHPDANHNLGVIAVQVKQPAIGLHFFKVALDANPNQGQYWLSYIDALIQADQTDTARKVLEQGLQQGLQGDAVNMLTDRLDYPKITLPVQPTELLRAIAHRENGHYKQAALVLESWLSGNQQDASSYALLAQVLSLDKQEEPAWVALNTALSINSALPIVLRNHARLLLKKKKPQEALQTAQAAYQNDPTDSESQLVLSAALAASNQIKQAIPLIEAALQSRPNYAEAYASRAQLKLRGNDTTGALADAEKALSIKPHLVQMWIMVSSLRYQQKNLQGAIDALERAISYEPDNIGYLVILGDYKRQNGAVQDAITLLAKVVAIAPDSADAWVNLGTAFQQAQLIPEAKAAYAKALYIEPALAEVSNNLGSICRDEDNYEEALRHFTRAIEIKPDFVEAHCNMGHTLRDLRRLVEAGTCYRQTLKIKPDYADALSNLGATLNHLGQLDEAEIVFRRALLIKPDNADTHYNLGVTLYKLGRLDDAEASYLRALEIKPNFAEAQNNLGNTYQDMGKLIEAETCYRQALQYNQNWASPHYNLHSLLLNSSDLTPSIKCLEKAVDIEPNNPEYSFFLGIMLEYTGYQQAASVHLNRSIMGTNLHQAKLDAWLYLKSANHTMPPITGSPIQAFKLGVAAANSDGLVMEFGVRFGSSIRQIATLVGQEVHGFDSFEGIPEQWHHEPKGSYSTKGVIPSVPSNVSLYAGWFEDTLPVFLKNHIGPVRFMNIDCDIYSSTKTILDLLADRIIPGTVIVFDEYIGNEHWREDEFKAFQEAVVKYGWRYEYICFSFFTKQVVIRIMQGQGSDPATKPKKESGGDIPIAELLKAAKPLPKKGKPAKRTISRTTKPTFQKQLPQTAYNQLVDLFNAKHYAELESRSRMLAGQYPDSGFAWKALGVSLQLQGKDPLPAFQKAAELLPGDADAHSNLGAALKDHGQLSDAVLSCRRALEIKPDYAEAHCNLGNALRDLGEIDNAVVSYRRALEIKPDLASAHNNLGSALKDLGQLDNAVASYRRALKIKPDYAEAHNNLGNALKDPCQLDNAVASYRRALKIKSDYAEAHYNLGNVLRDIGQLDHAEESFRRALEIKPDFVDALNNYALLLNAQGKSLAALNTIKQSLRIKATGEAKSIFVGCVRYLRFSHDNYEIRETLVRALSEPWDRPAELTRVSTDLVKLNPDIGECVARAAHAWPMRLATQDLFAADELAVLAADPLLCALLSSTPICDIEMEHFLTMARRTLLEADATMASDGGIGMALNFYSVLAQQCFINEYVFCYTDEEIQQVCSLRDSLVAALETGCPVPALWVLTVAAYIPLRSLPFAARLLDTQWPDALMAVLVQQVREPEEERQLLATIPRLTNIADGVSLLVQHQYEENPYPRWIKVSPAGKRMNIVEYLSRKFPLVTLAIHDKSDVIDILVAGCGTGQHSIGTAQLFMGAQVLAVDLSMSSLCYAKRKTRELGLTSIEYAQADLLELDSLGRSFDVIESVGVLHHLADPWAGLRALLSLLRPGGFMQLGFYSDIARRNLVKAQNFIVEQGYASTAEDIRRCRQDMLSVCASMGLEIAAWSSDFFSTSACRDLLFHVQEHLMTLAEIEAFLRDNNLKFLGFDINARILLAYKQRFPDDPAASNLTQWQTFEIENPDTFSGMYQFWIQK